MAVCSVVWVGGGGARDLVFVPEAKGKYMGECCCIYMGLVTGW